MASSWLILALLPALCLGTLPSSHAARAFFVFGDSLVDNGNNNYLVTAARADSPPYGIDTPDHRATGRFSNGKNVPDIISEHLGAEPVLPYLSPELDGDKMLVGANFASAGVGILNDTGIQFANVIHISKQLLYFQQYQKRLSSLIGAEQTARLVHGSLVLITLGGNDFVNNYYLVPYSARSREFSLPDYINYILSEYRQILTRLYDLGARRVLVQGVGPIGCVPAELALHSLDGSCDRELQRAAEMYNPRLMALLEELNARYGVRLRDGHPGVLRPGPLQRHGALHHGVQPLRRPRHLRVLGRLPPHGARQPPHRAAVHVRIHRLHRAHEPQHRPRRRPPQGADAHMMIYLIDPTPASSVFVHRPIDQPAAVMFVSD
ncbi:hypothetical protein PVAP13_1NG559000 [Panicum virgatum]|uniref:GDSL esterase/lipase n=1 Tax=Panicum virgatum TaxID=38727 RepID=A0A8T0XC99_PANVG|nr:hypothetical protein PVAP13_1NG559000 [Panicum virgatum]